MSSPGFDTLLLTGASGKLCSILRPGLRDLTRTLRLSDRDPLSTPLAAHETFIAGDLANEVDVAAMVGGVDAIVHMGGIAGEAHFAAILQSNLIGTFNLYHAALVHGVKRVVLASTNHVAGYTPWGETITPDAPMRPDSLYGISKGYGELLSRYYFDHYGIETVCLRIGTCHERPRSRRSLAMWLSYGDLIELVRCALTARDVGHLVVWGMSRNPDSVWDNTAAERIGYRPRDDAEDYRAEVEAMPDMADDDPRRRWQGGNMILKSYVDGGRFDEADLRPPLERLRHLIKP